MLEMVQSSKILNRVVREGFGEKVKGKRKYQGITVFQEDGKNKYKSPDTRLGKSKEVNRTSAFPLRWEVYWRVLQKEVI